MKTEVQKYHITKVRGVFYERREAAITGGSREGDFTN